MRRKIKNIYRVGLRTFVITCFIFSIIFILQANDRFCAAIELNNASRNINLASNKLFDAKQPHTVVLGKVNEQGVFEVEDIKRFVDGQEEEFIEFLKR